VIDILIDNSLLLLFVVVAIGYPLGRIRVFGSSLGVAAVLFVGLAVGAVHPDLELPEIVYQLGLVMFVYSLGLSSGPGFFASFRRKGLRDNLLVVGTIVAAGGVVALLKVLLHLDGAVAAGLFAGALTNTPALAGILDQIQGGALGTDLEPLLAKPVVGYSLAYPMGVLGGIVCIALLQRLWRVDYAAEAQIPSAAGAASPQLVNRTLRITRPEATVLSLADLVARHGWDVAFGRMSRAGRLSLSSGQTRFEIGDLVSAIGSAETLTAVAAVLGESTDERLELDRTEFDYRRMFVSNPKVAGMRVKDLHLQQQFGAVVTRVRRGDVEMLAHDDTVLELGDRVRVVTKRTNMEAVGRFFGDSYRALSEIDVLTFSLGLALGSLLGMVPIPLPGGIVFRLGLAGGPLIVALVLGWLGRIGPLVWSLPFSANITLRQIGLLLFLAGIGTRSGQGFAGTLSGGGGAAVLLLAGILIIAASGVVMLWIAHRLLRVPFGIAIGMLAGMQTQPAVLGFAVEQTHDDRPNVGYAAVYPLATISKILVAQVLLALLS
jgi:putative transport protein